MDASERLIKAAKNGNVKDVKKLLSHGALFTKDEFGNTALHEAAWSGNNEIVKILLKAYCFVDSVNGAGFTPLHLASQNGHAKVAKTLLKWKANPTLKNQHEESPIHLVAKYDHAHLVPVFAAAKSDLDLKAKDENTALHIAAKLSNTATVKALIQNGANPNITNQKSKFPLDYAEFSKCQEAVKLLSPFTRRQLQAAITAGVGVVSGGGGVYNTGVELELSKEAKGRRSFFKTRSSKSPKDIKTRNSSVAGMMPANGTPPRGAEVKMRQRSNTVSGTSNYSKRFSREFEDVSPFLSSGSNTSCTSSSGSGSVRRSKTRSPSLEDLIEEVERETQGPNYRYVPPPTSDSDNDSRSSVSYHPFNRLSSGSESPRFNNNTYNFFKQPKLSPTRSKQSPSPLLKSPKQDPLSNFMTPEGFLRPKETTIAEQLEKKDDEYVCLRPASEVHRRPLPFDRNKNTQSVPLLSDEVLSHTYEYLPPLPGKKLPPLPGKKLPPLPGKKEEELEGFESYVEMSPRIGVQLKPSSSTNAVPQSPLKFSPVKKVALISDERSESSPAKQIADSSTSGIAAPKSILTQFEGEKRHSEIDKYLQDELDTIRQACQIRLTQMEKRYKRYLASVSSIQQQTPSNNVPVEFQPENDTFTRKHNRRASWHGKMKQEDTTDQAPSGTAYALGGSGFDSGSEESLASSVADSSVCYNDNRSDRFDQINDVQQDEKHLQEFTDEDTAALSDEKMRSAIQERLQQYKAQMMEQWMREAEEKIALMEQDYMKKLSISQNQQQKQEYTHMKPTNGVMADCSETFV